MTHEHEERIRTRAYEIWEREGCPHGREREHWLQARRELDREEDESGTRHGGLEARGESTDPAASGGMEHGQEASHERRPPDLHDAIAELDQTLDALVEVIAGDRDLVEKVRRMRVPRLPTAPVNGGRADEASGRRAGFRPASADWRGGSRRAANAS